jgi:hypothetical protein
VVPVFAVLKDVAASDKREGVRAMDTPERQPENLDPRLIDQVREDLDLVFPESGRYTLADQDGKLLITFDESTRPDTRRFAEAIIRLSCVPFKTRIGAPDIRKPSRGVR